MTAGAYDTDGMLRCERDSEGRPRLCGFETRAALDGWDRLPVSDGDARVQFPRLPWQPQAAVALRIDDIGAASKQWERHGRGLGNVWPFSHRRLLGAWGPYPELTAWQLEAICAALDAHECQATLAVTACWMERDGREIVYPVKYPAQAATIKRWVDRGTVEVANHGLRHCQAHGYRPRLLGNRTRHREFTGNEGPDEMVRTVRRAQQILGDWLGEAPTTFIPPGLQLPYTDYALAGIPSIRRIVRAGDAQGVVWHDRDFVTEPGAFQRFRAMLATGRYCAVRDVSA